jgi:hypothetical protein
MHRQSREIFNGKRSHIGRSEINAAVTKVSGADDGGPAQGD